MEVATTLLSVMASAMEIPMETPIDVATVMAITEPAAAVSLIQMTVTVDIEREIEIGILEIRAR